MFLDLDNLTSKVLTTESNKIENDQTGQDGLKIEGNHF